MQETQSAQRGFVIVLRHCRDPHRALSPSHCEPHRRLSMVKPKHAVLLLLIVLGFVAYWYWDRYLTPHGQAPIASLTANNFNQVKEAFNDTTDRTRLVLLVSPT